MSYDAMMKKLLKPLIAKLAERLKKHVEFFYLEIEGEQRPCIRVADSILLAWHPRPKGV